MPWKHKEGAEVELYSFLISVQNRSESLTLRCGRFNTGKSWVGYSRSGRVAEETNLFLETRTVKPVAQTYQLRYPASSVKQQS
jgi:hypothetical protein